MSAADIGGGQRCDVQVDGRAWIETCSGNGEGEVCRARLDQIRGNCGDRRHCAVQAPGDRSAGGGLIVGEDWIVTGRGERGRAGQGSRRGRSRAHRDGCTCSVGQDPEVAGEGCARPAGSLARGHAVDEQRGIEVHGDKCALRGVWAQVADGGDPGGGGSGCGCRWRSQRNGKIGGRRREVLHLRRLEDIDLIGIAEGAGEGIDGNSILSPAHDLAEGGRIPLRTDAVHWNGADLVEVAFIEGQHLTVLRERRDADEGFFQCRVGNHRSVCRRRRGAVEGAQQCSSRGVEHGARGKIKLPVVVLDGIQLTEAAGESCSGGDAGCIHGKLLDGRACHVESGGRSAEAERAVANTRGAVGARDAGVVDGDSSAAGEATRHCHRDGVG